MRSPRRTVLVLAAAAVLTLAPIGHAAEPDPEKLPPARSPPEHALWLEPIGTLALGPTAGIVYVSLGANLALPSWTELVIEAAFTSGKWVGCNTRQTGGWFAAGPLFHTGDEPLNGFFIQPKLRGRLMGTPSGSSGGGWFGSCSVPSGIDGEIGGALDLGYEWSTGGFRAPGVYFALFVGINAGVCLHCAGDGPIWTGGDYEFELFGEGPSGRSTRAVVGPNINFFRLGMSF
jgi:hypothetical protein